MELVRGHNLSLSQIEDHENEDVVIQAFDVVNVRNAPNTWFTGSLILRTRTPLVVQLPKQKGA